MGASSWGGVGPPLGWGEGGHCSGSFGGGGGNIVCLIVEYGIMGRAHSKCKPTRNPQSNRGCQGAAPISDCVDVLRPKILDVPLVRLKTKTNNEGIDSSRGEHRKSQPRDNKFTAFTAIVSLYTVTSTSVHPHYSSLLSIQHDPRSI